MNFQAKSMASAMKKTFHVAVLSSGLITALDKKFLHCFMNCRCQIAVTHLTERNFLSLPNGVIKFANSFAGISANHCARNVAEITCFLRAWKNIQDDWFMGAQRSKAAFV